MTEPGSMSCDGPFGIGTFADAPPPIAKDTPAAPKTGKAILGCFRFEGCFARAMTEASYRCEQILDRR